MTARLSILGSDPTGLDPFTLTYIHIYVLCIHIYIYTPGSIQFSILVQAFSAGLDIGAALVLYPDNTKLFYIAQTLVCTCLYRLLSLALMSTGYIVYIHIYIYQQYLGLMRSGDKQMLRNKIIFILCFFSIKRFFLSSS